MAKEVKKSILEAGRNKIMELADYELEKVMANINDINTDPKKKRKITIELTFAPSEDRKQIVMTSQVKSKVEPTKPTETTLFNVLAKDDETGEIFPVLKEVSDIAIGQLDIYGDVKEQEIFVIGMGAAKAVKKEVIGEDTQEA